MKIKQIYKKNLIKVIDTPYSSFLIEKILYGRTNIKEIIEIKKDLGETKLKAENFLKISQKNIFQKKKFITTHSTAFKWSKFRILNFINFFKLRKEILKKIKFKHNQIYIGSKTSTIMNVLPRKNRILIDHGFSDYYSKAQKISSYKKIIDKFKEIISNNFGYPYISLRENINGYTVCKIPKYSKNFIDLQNLPINKFLMKILNRIKKDNSSVKKIFLLSKNWEENHFSGLSSKVDYDKINLELIKKYAKKGEKFFIKYHGFDLVSNQIDISFEKKINSLGFYAIDIDNFFQTCFKGLVPAELLIGKLKLKKVISKYSSTLHNICHNKSIDCIMDINPELNFIYDDSYEYKKKLLNEYNQRNIFNSFTGKKVNIKPIN
tara:strand:- start:11259 stop:12392 length:1134 start_codon:yes stop_codon:yes gene_type:complete